MGGPNQQRSETSRTQGDGETLALGPASAEAEETSPGESGVNQPFYAHTHAGFTHSKNRPGLSTGPVLARCKNWIDGDSPFFL